MFLFVGLGNPGKDYADNRHNIGFMAVDAIARGWNFPAFRKKHQGLVSEGRIGEERVILLMPQTYMNESGRSVQEAARFHKIGLSDIFVFHDELDLAAGKLRIKTGGGNAGHNGLKSISAHVGNDYHRIRFGIGHPGDKDRVHGHVLSDFSKADMRWVEPMLEEVAKNADCILASQFSRLQNLVHTAIESKAPAAIKPDKDKAPEP